MTREDDVRRMSLSELQIKMRELNSELESCKHRSYKREWTSFSLLAGAAILGSLLHNGSVFLGGFVLSILVFACWPKLGRDEVSISADQAAVQNELLTKLFKQ